MRTNHAYVIGSHVPEMLVGNILEIIETAGMKESQEKAIKSLVKDKIYEIIRYSQVVTDELESQIKEAGHHYNKEVPNSIVGVTEMKKQLDIDIEDDVHAILSIYDWNKMPDKTKGDLLVWLESQMETLQSKNPNISNQCNARLMK